MYQEGCVSKCTGFSTEIFQCPAPLLHVLLEMRYMIRTRCFALMPSDLLLSLTPCSLSLSLSLAFFCVSISF